LHSKTNNIEHSVSKWTLYIIGIRRRWKYKRD